MTVPSETNRSGPYNGNGSTTDFAYGFRIVDEDHLRVILTSALGVEATLTIDTDYTVSDVGEAAGGEVTLTDAPATGETITILRNVPFVQETDLENQGAYYAETVEDAFDLAAMRDQQLAEEVARAVKVPAAIDDVDLQLPAPEAGKIISWNENADGLQNLSPSELSSVVAYGTANADIFEGDGATTVFALSANPAALNNLDVAIGGVTQLPGVDYTWTNGTNITFTTAPADGVVILVRYMQALAQGTTEAELVLTDNDSNVQAELYKRSYTIETYTDIAATTIPAIVDNFYLQGYAAVGDGGGGQYKRVGSAAQAQSDDGAHWALAEVAPSVLQFGYFAGSDDLDDELDDALEFAAGKTLYFPNQGTPYLITGTHIVPTGTTIIGDGRGDRWNDDYDIGTVIQTSGAGNAARWTDIDGSDAADDTPMFVAAGNNVWFKYISLYTPDDANAWSSGFFFPCVKQCGMIQCSAFGFTDGCAYLDATWSTRNTTLLALHPGVISDLGMNEFYSEGFWGIAATTGGFAVKTQGTTRAHDAVATSDDWLWAPGGTSDILFLKGRLTGRHSAGGGFKHDAQFFGAANTFGQGITFRDVAFRGNGGGYSASLDRSNRIIFDGCYGETVGGGNHAFNVTSRTQTSVDGIIRVNDKLNVPIYLDDVDTGFTGSTVPWRAARCIVTHRVDGRNWTPNFESSRAASQIMRHISWATKGEIRFAHDDGSTITSYLRFLNDSIRPETAGAITLGETAAPFAQLNAKKIASPFSDLTIASGVVTVTGTTHRVDTEAAAATDDLDTINGGIDGQLLIIKSVASARDVTLKDGTGNLQLAGDFVLDTSSDTIMLVYYSVANLWYEICRSNNA